MSLAQSDRYDSFLEIRDSEYRCALFAFERLDQREVATDTLLPEYGLESIAF